LAEYHINTVRERQKDEIYTYTFFSIYTSYTSKKGTLACVCVLFFCVGDFVDRYVKYRGKYGLLKCRCPFFGIINKSFAKFVKSDKNRTLIVVPGI
jgi:hypothetical protein